MSETDKFPMGACSFCAEPTIRREFDGEWFRICRRCLAVALKGDTDALKARMPDYETWQVLCGAAERRFRIAYARAVAGDPESLMKMLE